MSWPVIVAALLVLAYSGGCTSAPSYETVIVTKQAYVTTAKTVRDLAPEFTPDEARAIKAIDDEAHAALHLLVARFLEGKPLTSGDALATLRSALLRLARFQFEAEARKAARATTRPVARIDEGSLPPPDHAHYRYLRASY